VFKQYQAFLTLACMHSFSSCICWNSVADMAKTKELSQKLWEVVWLLPIGYGQEHFQDIKIFILKCNQGE